MDYAISSKIKLLVIVNNNIVQYIRLLFNNGFILNILKVINAIKRINNEMIVILTTLFVPT